MPTVIAKRPFYSTEHGSVKKGQKIEDASETEARAWSKRGLVSVGGDDASDAPAAETHEKESPAHRNKMQPPPTTKTTTTTGSDTEDRTTRRK